MRYFIFCLFLLLFATQPGWAQPAKYMDNYSCKECHEQIYDEYQSSAHSQSFFSNTFHQDIAKQAHEQKYECAVCHMPMANNLQDLIEGKAKPDINNKTHTDGVSCFFCHTIAYVKKSHKYNINIQARQAEGYKPTLYGTLIDPDDSDKHSSTTNPVYTANVCKGCHSHKVNDNNITVFRTMENAQSSKDCIKCHMPEIQGGAEKIDKRSRGHHASHKFLGIHDEAFRATGMDINLSVENEQLNVMLTNKMSHPLIIQAARAKFLKITIERDGKEIWKNYQKDPREDKAGYFAYSFAADNRHVVVPATATQSAVNNLEAKETKQLTYQILPLQKGDNVKVALYVQLARDDCKKVMREEDIKLTQPLLMKEVVYIQK